MMNRNPMLILFFCALVAPVWGLERPAQGQGQPYRIGVNDVVDIVIFAGGERQNEETLTVSGNGTVNVPFIGTVQAVGSTLAELEDRIAGPLAENYFVDPKVSVQVRNYRSQYYYISGAVNSPGLYHLATEATLLVLIAEAGGVTPERGGYAQVMRGSAMAGIAGTDARQAAAEGDVIKVDLQRLMDQGEFGLNIPLYPGDVVYIPVKASAAADEDNVYLEGEVKKPGVYAFKSGMTVLNACILAGGFDTFAAPNRTRVIREVDGQLNVIKINLNDVKDGKIPDIELMPGDRIHIPETWL